MYGYSRRQESVVVACARACLYKHIETKQVIVIIQAYTMNAFAA
jgi:hypothetical protein